MSAAAGEHVVSVGGLRIEAMRGGAGPLLLLLHHSTGNVGWTPFHARLAAEFDVVAPDLPGYGRSDLPEWAREPRDIAILMLQYLRRLSAEPVTLVGFGFGGWVAAEMATMHQGAIDHLVLCGTPGLKPEEGEILDQMVVDHAEYVRTGFRDEATATEHLGETIDPNLVALWQFNRVMTARVSWKPYMFNPRLAPLLAAVDTPTLVVHGGADRVVPLSVARQYARALPYATLEIIADAGHLVEIEEPDRVAELVRTHVTSGTVSQPHG
jgi:pimeloyl-ACP methyl ester carboxylesterase